MNLVASKRKSVKLDFVTLKTKTTLNISKLILKVEFFYKKTRVSKSEYTYIIHYSFH